MSFGFSPGDVLTALKLCAWIEKNCFDPTRNASVLYTQFKNDVLTLQGMLKDFSASFTNALNQFPISDQSRVDMLKNEAEKLVGDYCKTLEDCKTLLMKHANLEGDPASAFSNAFWHASTQPDVEELRKRLQSHSHNFSLMVNSIGLDITTTIYENLQDLRIELREGRGKQRAFELPPIPDFVDSAFKRALMRDAPVPFDGLDVLPLRESVGALMLNFRACTTPSTNPGIGPDIEQNLGLIRAHWLFKTIKNSRTFKQSQYRPLYLRVFLQIEIGLENKYRTLPSQNWDEGVFADLADEAFSIWPVKEIPKLQVSTDPVNDEVVLVQAKLASPYPGRAEQLLIFRAAEKTLRTVHSRTSNDNQIGPQEVRYHDLDVDGLLPLYAVEDTSKGLFVVEMTFGKNGIKVVYKCPAHSEACLIQKAFTGYDVMSYTAGVSCTLTYRSRFFRCPQDNAKGEVQMWQWPVPAVSQNAGLSPSTGTEGNENHSPHAGSMHYAVSQAFQDLGPTIISIGQGENGGEFVIARLPPPPLLVFLVRQDGKYAMWRIDLSELKIEKHKLPLRTILAPEGNYFTVHRLIVDESNRNAWNVCAIASCPPNTAENQFVESLKGNSVIINFATVENQTRFETHLKFIAATRMKQIRQLEIDKDEACKRVRGGVPDSGTRNTPTKTSTFRTGLGGSRESLPPLLGPLRTLTLLGQEDEHNEDMDESR